MQIQHWRYLAQLARRSTIQIEKKTIYNIGNNGLFSKQQSRVYSDQASSSSSKQTLESITWKDVVNLTKDIGNSIESNTTSDEQNIPLDTLISFLNDVETPYLDRVGAYQNILSRQQDQLKRINDESIRLLSEQAIQQGYTHILSTILDGLYRGQFALEKDPLRRSKVVTSIVINLTKQLEKIDDGLNGKNSFEKQLNQFKSASSENMKSACKILNEDLELLKETGQALYFFNDIGSDAALHLSISIALMDTEYELIPLLYVLLDILLANPSSSFRSINEMSIFIDTLVRYLLHSNRLQFLDERAENDALSYTTRIVELVDQTMSMYGLSNSLKSELFSEIELDELLVRCKLSPSDRNRIQALLFARSTVASITIQSRSYSSSVEVLFEMFNDLKSNLMTTSVGNVTILDLELILLQGFRFLLRSVTSQIDLYESKIVTRLLPILIRHALLDNRSDDLLWLRDFGNRLLESGKGVEFSKVVMQTIKELNSMNEGNSAGFDVLAMFGGQLIISAIEQIAYGQSNKMLLLSFLKDLQIIKSKQTIVGDARIDLVFLDTLRTRLIITCMNGGLRTISNKLFMRWREVHVQEPITVELIKSQLSSFEDISRIKDSKEEEENPEQFNDFSPHAVSSSSQCACVIVNSNTRYGMKRRYKEVDKWLRNTSSTDQPLPVLQQKSIPREIRLAYDALFSFMMSKKRENWNEKDIINVAQMLFRLGHTNEAKLCLSSIPKQEAKYQENAIATLARGLAERNLKEGIEFLEQTAEVEDSVEFITDKVIGPVFTLAMFEGKIELVQRLLNLSEKAGVMEELAMRSKNVLTMTAYDKERKGFKNYFDISQEDEMKSSKDDIIGIPSVFEDVRLTQRWLYSLLERGLLSSDPEIIKKIIIGCVTRAEKIRKDHVEAGNTKIGDAISDRMNRLASSLLHYSAQELHCIDFEAAMMILSSFHFNSGHKAKGGIRAYQQQKMNELDAIVSAMRWVTEFRIIPKRWKNADLIDDEGNEKEEHLLKKTKSNLLQRDDALINILPPMTFRSLISAYSRLNDNLGVASIIQWVRDECGMSLEELSSGWKGKEDYNEFVKKRIYLSSQRGSLDSSNQTLKWVSGQESVPLIKSWWYEPKQKED